MSTCILFKMLAGNEVKAEYGDACYNPVSISFFKQLWVKKLNLMFQYVAMWWCLGVGVGLSRTSRLN